MAKQESSSGAAGRPKREPGDPSAVADRRGGPANFGGVDFQIDYTVHRILAWLLERWGDPTGSGVIRCEPRIIGQDDSEAMTLGQHGFDVALTDRTHHAPDYREVKRSPSQAEVVELVSSLCHISTPSDGGERVVGMVTQSATTPYTRLCKLYDYGREATNDSELANLVAVADKAEMTELFDALGEHPWATLRLMTAPEQWAETILAEQIRLTAHTLAGDAELGQRLVDRLRARVAQASERREAMRLGVLGAEMVEAGLLRPQPTPVAPEDDELAGVFVALEACPVPLPKLMLAKAMGRSVDDVATLLGEALETGHVMEYGDAWFRVTQPENRLASRFGQPLLGEILAVIHAWAGDIKAKAAGQTLNAYALAKLCLDSRPEIVADLFRSFDKASKRWGDLDIVWKLAQLSDQALLHVMNGNLSADQRAGWAKVRAQTYICGQGWVLQRVAELAEAIRFMDLAKAISAEYRDDENHAFTLKCEGRLRRMQAELLPLDDVVRVEHLHASVDLLTEAEVAFEALIPTMPRLVSDRGESVSLLARTLATKPDFDDAARVAQRAEELLATRTEEKAYADLKILQAELFWRGTEPTSAGFEEERGRHHDVLADLLAKHDTGGRHGPGSGGDRGASEVVARLHLALALLEEQTDAAGARTHYKEAAEVYRRLNYRPGLEDALWHDRLMSGDIVPAGLRAALDAIDAEPGVALLALDQAEQMSTGGAAAATIDPTSPTDNFSAEEWDDIVSDAKAQHAATKPRWADGRTSA